MLHPTARIRSLKAEAAARDAAGAEKARRDRMALEQELRVIRRQVRMRLKIGEEYSQEINGRKYHFRKVKGGDIKCRESFGSLASRMAVRATMIVVASVMIKKIIFILAFGL